MCGPKKYTVQCVLRKGVIYFYIFLFFNTFLDQSTSQDYENII